MEKHELPLNGENTYKAMPPPSRHPLVALSLFFMAGCAVGMLHPWNLRLAAAATCACAASWFVLRQFARRSSSWLFASSLALGMTAGAAACCHAMLAAQEDYESVEMLREIIESREDATVRGRIASAPSVVMLRNGAHACVRFDFEVMEVPFEHDNVPMPDSLVRVDWYSTVSLLDDDNPPFRIPREGEGWQLVGRMREINTRSAVPLVTLSIGGGKNNSKRYVEMDCSPAAAALWRLRSYAGRALSIGVDEDRYHDSLSIIKAMTLGYRSDLPSEVMDFFRLSGTVHVFSISGLHVGIIAALVMGALCIFPFPQKLRVFVFCIVLVLYTTAVGARSSAVRACVMSLFLFNASLLKRKIDPASALSGAAIFILAVDPRQVVDLGFILSFACTAGILAFVPVLKSSASLAIALIRQRIVAPREETVAIEHLIGLDGMPLSRPRNSWSLARYLRDETAASIAVSLAAWMSSVPVTALMFGQMTPISILCNLLVVPVAAAIVVVGALSMISAIISPWLADVFNHANVIITEFMVWAARVSSGIPGGNFEVEPWSAGGMVAWCLAMTAWYFIARALVSDPEHAKRPHAM